MCVIFIAEKTRPTPEMVEQAFAANREGAGIAWRETVQIGRKEEVVVKWKKGLDVEEIGDLVATLPLPFIAHFRISTCGGTRASLCHPFPVDKDAPLDLKGQTRGLVLFHNGHWTRWKDTVLEAVVTHNLRLPGGKWSDSRAMAWAAATYGISVLEMIDEKSVVFGPTEVEVTGTGWSQVNDVWCSNRNWENRSWQNQGYVSSVCVHSTCKKARHNNTLYCLDHQSEESRGITRAPMHRHVPGQAARELGPKAGGTSDQSAFRAGSQAAHTGQAQQEGVQEGSEGVGGAGKGGKKEAAGTNVLTDPQKAFVWAARLNPKAVRGGVTVKNLDDEDAAAAARLAALMNDDIIH